MYMLLYSRHYAVPLTSQVVLNHHSSMSLSNELDCFMAIENKQNVCISVKYLVRVFDLLH